MMPPAMEAALAIGVVWYLGLKIMGWMDHTLQGWRGTLMVAALIFGLLQVTTLIIQRTTSTTVVLHYGGVPCADQPSI